MIYTEQQVIAELNRAKKELFFVVVPIALFIGVAVAGSFGAILISTMKLSHSKEMLKLETKLVTQDNAYDELYEKYLHIELKGQ